MIEDSVDAARIIVSNWNSFLFSLLASIQDDPQPVLSQRLGGHIPGEALEERGQPLCVWLLLWGAGARHRAWECSASHPHAASLPHQCASASHLLCGGHPERGPATVCDWISTQSRRHLPGFRCLVLDCVEFQWHLCDCSYPVAVHCCQDYFGVCTEAAIKDNVVVVYELLEEMLDNGFPLATESNILKELIKPPTILRTMVNTITGTVTWQRRGTLVEKCDQWG